LRQALCAVVDVLVGSSRDLVCIQTVVHELARLRVICFVQNHCENTSSIVEVGFVVGILWVVRVVVVAALAGGSSAVILKAECNISSSGGGVIRDACQVVRRKTVVQCRINGTHITYAADTGWSAADDLVVGLTILDCACYTIGSVRIEGVGTNLALVKVGNIGEAVWYSLLRAGRCCCS